MKRVLITGGAGFLGHHVVEHILINTDWHIVILDKLTYASMGLERIREVSECFKDDRLTILACDFANPLSAGIRKEIGDINYILHLGAETHVDRSISDPMIFVTSNVLGTANMLEYARTCKNLEWFNIFSTDEVYGPAPDGINYKETDRHNPTNPYSATKSGAEQLALAYANTYKVPVFVTNTMNIFGERQHSEKFIPLCINKILKGETIQIHSSPDKKVAGSRFWIHARNVASALLFLLENASFRESYNIVGDREVNNLDLAMYIADVLNKELKYEMVDFHSSRPGHDLRYALDGKKMFDLGWKSPLDLRKSLKNTILWTTAHKNWLKQC